MLLPEGKLTAKKSVGKEGYVLLSLGKKGWLVHLTSILKKQNLASLLKPFQKESKYVARKL